MLLIQSLAIFATIASATSFQAWNGDHCDGSAGTVVTVHGSGSCEEVGNRHSWTVNGDNVKGYYYSGSNCQGASTAFRGSNHACNNINTGGTVRSMCVTGDNNGGCGF